MKELCKLYNEVNMLLDVVKMMDGCNFKSPEAKAWNEGSKFAYENVLKIIYNKVKDEDERKEISNQ